MTPLWTTATCAVPLPATCGWALASVAGPWVAHRVWLIPTVPGAGCPARKLVRSPTRPARLRRCSRSPVRVASPALSYPRYSSRLSPSTRIGSASRGPTYPTMPHTVSLLVRGLLGVRSADQGRAANDAEPASLVERPQALAAGEHHVGDPAGVRLVECGPDQGAGDPPAAGLRADYHVVDLPVDRGGYQEQAVDGADRPAVQGDVPDPRPDGQELAPGPEAGADQVPEGLARRL